MEHCFFFFFICFYNFYFFIYMELLRLQADIYFHKCVLDTCHKQVITVILIFFFLFKKKKKKGEDVTCTSGFPV